MLDNSLLLKKKTGSLLAWDPAVVVSGVTLSNTNSRATLASNSRAGARGTIGKTTGKWYTEILIVQTESGWSGGAAPMTGICSERTGLSNVYGGGALDQVLFYGSAPNNAQVSYAADARLNYGTFVSAGGVIGICLDLDNNTIEFILGGTARGKLSLSTYSNLGHTYYPVSCSVNAGGSPAIVDFTTNLVNPIPSGFSRW